ncbi:hypothetical protein AWC24_00280 [Mycolicibacter senuensis]|nr:hypothetical protein AWC24_00280 [Mycolicibacter senuensis]
MTTANTIQACGITISTRQPGTTATAVATSPGLAIGAITSPAAITIGAPNTTGTGVAAGPTGLPSTTINLDAISGRPDSTRRPDTTVAAIAAIAAIAAKSTTTMGTSV